MHRLTITTTAPASVDQQRRVDAAVAALAPNTSKTLLIRASKSDQQGEGSTRYVGPATLAAVQRYLEAAGHAAGPLFRQVRY